MTKSSQVVARYDFPEQAEVSVRARNAAESTDAYRMERDPIDGFESWVIIRDNASTKES
jgi:hypothetical protein